jgi:hypothetical protein
MMYNISLHLNVVLVTFALTAATAFVLISIAKEKRDERKRA